MVAPVLEDYRTKYDHIQFERDDGVLEMKLHSDGEDLVWGFAPHEELGYAFGDVGDDSENEVIILTGSGDTFIDEEDLGVDEIEPGDWQAGMEDGKRLLMNLLDIPAPIIAAVNGPATVHSELAVLSDIVLASEDTYFKDKPHFRNGLVPGDGVQVVWPMLLGLNRGRQFLLMDEKLTAQEAQELGVVAEVLPREDLLPRAREVADYIQNHPSITVRYLRETILREVKRRMQADLGYGLAMEGIAGMDHWPEEFE